MTAKRSSATSAALKGIFSGGVLAAVEIIGGLMSGSLGLISSALNSLMDFIAAIITFFAVRESSKPADEAHMYGHEKIESAAAIGEILLLFFMCIWIVFTAVDTLLSGEALVEQFWVAMGTNFLSICLDLFAFISLRRTSRANGSQASEASALHFLNDLLIAVMVIVGLGLYRFGLWYADSVAALGIVAYIGYSSIGLLKSAMSMLVDAAPKGTTQELRKQILAVEGVKSCHRIRTREAGSRIFVDANIEIDGLAPLSQAHSVASEVEKRILQAFPNADILIHTEPFDTGDPLATIRSQASRIPEIEGIHNIIMKTIRGKLSVSYHLEFNQETSTQDAHDIASRLERSLQRTLRNTSAIVSHLEPVTGTGQQLEYQEQGLTVIREQIVGITQAFPEVKSAHEIEILGHNGKLSVTMHCTIDGRIPIGDAHDTASKIEAEIKRLDARISEVTIHCEPEQQPTPDEASQLLVY